MQVANQWLCFRWLSSSWVVRSQDSLYRVIVKNALGSYEIKLFALLRVGLWLDRYFTGDRDTFEPCFPA